MAISKLKLDITENQITLYGTQDKKYVTLYEILQRLSNVSMGSIIKVDRSDNAVVDMNDVYYLVIKPYDVLSLVYVNLQAHTVSEVATETLQHLKVDGISERVSSVVTLHFIESLCKVKGFLHIMDLTCYKTTKCKFAKIKNAQIAMNENGSYSITYLKEDLIESYKSTLKFAWDNRIVWGRPDFGIYVIYDTNDNILFFA